MGSIKRMPEAIWSSIRSGVILYDFTRVVEELVFNSLDAGATKVSVAIGIGTCYVKVDDNGSGVSRDGLVLMGERYAIPDDMHAFPASFGFKGESLSSISDFSLLEIVTKTHGRPNGYRKVLKDGKCLYLGIDDCRQDIGTTVHPIVSFKIVDIESEDDLLCTRASPSPLPLLSSGFGIHLGSLNKLSASDGSFKLSGYISGPDVCRSVQTGNPEALRNLFHLMFPPTEDDFLDNKFNASASSSYKSDCLLGSGWEDESQAIVALNQQRMPHLGSHLNLMTVQIDEDIKFEKTTELKQNALKMIMMLNLVVDDVNQALNQRSLEARKYILRTSPGLLSLSPEPSPLPPDPLLGTSPGNNNVKTVHDVPLMQKLELECTAHDLESKEELVPTKTQSILDSGTKWRDFCPETTSHTGTENLKNQETILNITSGILHFVGNSLVPDTIDKNCLEGAKVLQQVDKKFIPIVAGATLAIIDQILFWPLHNERIRLESCVLSGKKRTTTYLDSEQERMRLWSCNVRIEFIFALCVLACGKFLKLIITANIDFESLTMLLRVMPEISYQLLHNYADQIQNWGWICNIHSQASRSFTRNLNLIYKQPTPVTLLYGSVCFGR
ncbi:hypothetical protein HAX54_045638 [Datura stramonium]|uniref:DNA mismatch repair protein MLH3 n=1 Tax=Datura stramonium TaxID=4076 RepID=A0ABS8RPG4_DATST|nr:hypothetical protein [Datura stramonium]